MMIAPRNALLCTCLMLLPVLPHLRIVGQGPPATSVPYSPPVAPASGLAEGLTRRMKLPAGFAASVFAAEPMVANPVAFWMTSEGVCYVAETFRQDPRGIPDNRTRPSWIADDLASRTVEDRAALYRRHHPGSAWEWTRDHERIRRLVDLDADGRADRATVFADGFNGLLDGTGAGVLARGPDVFYACIPHLWRLRDKDGDGYAEERTALHRGYGVRVAFRGHDLHGLVLGPDGRLYFSIGDRGYHITTPDGRTLADSNSGAVFRCELDGTGLEVFATGLRNPQDLAFDDLGNLFTGDNNADAGDAARIVYVVRDGDSGWRGSFQYLEECGPWRRERWCEPAHPGQAAFLVPPVATLGNGLAGLASYPGTGLPDRYRGSFLLCDFVGARRKSGLRASASSPMAAASRWVTRTGSRRTASPPTCTSVPTVRSTSLTSATAGQGTAPAASSASATSRPRAGPRSGRSRSCWREGFDARAGEELEVLLGHADRRVRDEARLALVGRGHEGLTHLEEAAREAPALAARLQGLWASAPRPPGGAPAR